MLEDLFPRAHEQYKSLPLLGCMVEGFATWMSEKGYRRSTLRAQFKTVARLDRSLRRRGAKRLADITPEMLEACWIALRRQSHQMAGLVHALWRYLEALAILPSSAGAAPSSRVGVQLAAYQAHLTDVRGLAHNTVRNHLATAAAFLDHLDYDLGRSSRLTPQLLIKTDPQAIV